MNPSTTAHKQRRFLGRVLGGSLVEFFWVNPGSSCRNVGAPRNSSSQCLILPGESQVSDTAHITLTLSWLAEQEALSHHQVDGGPKALLPHWSQE